MNAKQTVPIVATLAPVIAAAPGLLIIGGLVLLARWLLSDDDRKKPETVPAAPSRSPVPNPPNSAGNSVQNRSIPANSGGKPIVTPAPSAPASARVPVISVPAVPIIPVPPPLRPIPATKTAPEIPQPPPKKIITREDMATVFYRGTRALNRKDAVAALIGLGFGKSAAYDALSEYGRFSAWLQFAPDGIITWRG